MSQSLGAQHLRSHSPRLHGRTDCIRALRLQEGRTLGKEFGPSLEPTLVAPSAVSFYVSSGHYARKLMSTQKLFRDPKANWKGLKSCQLILRNSFHFISFHFISKMNFKLMKLFSTRWETLGPCWPARTELPGAFLGRRSVVSDWILSRYFTLFHFILAYVRQMWTYVHLCRQKGLRRSRSPRT